MLAESAIEIVRNSPRNSYNEGLHASFKPINEQWGLKFYTDESMRDETYILQSKAYEIGCGPELGDKFDLTTPDGDEIFGYITEIVRTEEKNGWGAYTCEDEMSEMYPEYDDLVKKLSEIMYVSDLHGGNIGWTKDGRMVAIDFSFCS